MIGYAMTEKQGGSDLRETQTTAVFSHSDNYHGATAHWYELTGHKWFCSVPVADGFFTLAEVKGGVTCFFLPRTLPDGTFNRFSIQRLKDKAATGPMPRAKWSTAERSRSESGTRVAAFARISTPAAKYFKCSRAPAIAYEALQCHGGNGFIEENPMARIYREAPLNSVWEGTANMMCMDVRRSLHRVPGVREAFRAEVASVAAADERMRTLLQATEKLMDAALEDEFVTRPLTEMMSRTIQAAELMRYAPSRWSTRSSPRAGLDTRVHGDLTSAPWKAA